MAEYNIDKIESDCQSSRSTKKPKKPMLPWIILFVVITINLILLVILMAVIVSKINHASNDVSQPGTGEQANEIYFEDNDFEGTWLTNYQNIRASTFDPDKIKKTGNLFQYIDSQTPSYVGVDVSEHQGDIDWEQVANYGIDFAMIRVGWRGYETGILHEDDTFLQNIQGAKDAGLKVGLYFFSQACTAEEAEEEATFLLDHIQGYSIDYPIAYDWERISEESSRAKDITSEELTKCARVFCDTIKEAGYHPMLYSYKYMLYYRYDLDQLSDVDFWLSRPGTDPGLYYAFQMWQYDTKASIDGINGQVDLDLCLKTY